MTRTSAYLMVLLTITFTVYGQLVIKWQALAAGPLPSGLLDRFHFMFSLVLNPWVLSAFFAAFLASLAWIAAMTKLPISQAYPLNAMTFILVVICGGAFFSEPFGLHKVLGLILIVLGILIASQGPV